jgi:hypothetical protein
MKDFFKKITSDESIKQLKSALGSYLRAALAAVGAMVLAGIEDPSAITVSALLAGILGPLIRALDPNQDEYGIGAKVQAAVKNDVPSLDELNDVDLDDDLEEEAQ